MTSAGPLQANALLASLLIMIPLPLVARISCVALLIKFRLEAPPSVLNTPGP